MSNKSNGNNGGSFFGNLLIALLVIIGLLAFVAILVYAR